eukprot:1273684-Pyramimonas_sp.AAC.1
MHPPVPRPRLVRLHTHDRTLREAPSVTDERDHPSSCKGCDAVGPCPSCECPAADPLRRGFALQPCSRCA